MNDDDNVVNSVLDPCMPGHFPFISFPLRFKGASHTVLTGLKKMNVEDELLSIIYTLQTR